MIRNNRNQLLKLILLSALVKVAYWLLNFAVTGDTGQLSFNGYAELIKRHDTGWFEEIATKGYPVIEKKEDLGYHRGAEYKQSSWAFFPLYPLMMKTTMQLLKVDFSVAAFLWSLIFSSLALTGFYIFTFFWFKDVNRAFFYSLLFLLFPFHFYFSMAYTEAVYFTCLIFCFIAIACSKSYWLLLLSIPLVLIRPNGIVSLLPLMIYFLEQKNLKSITAMITSRKLLNISLLLLPGFFAFAGFCVYQKQMTGFYFAFSIAQQGWYKEFMFPLLAFFRRGDFATQFYSVYSILFIVVAVYGWKKFPLSINVFIWLNLLLPLSSGSVTSMQRYLSVIFPLTWILAGWMYSSNRKNLFIAACFALQLFVFYFWIKGDSFTY